MELYEKVKALPFQYCKNVQTLAFKVGIPMSTIHHTLKKGLLKHTLTDKNKAARAMYCRSFVWDGQCVC
jgi:hypothetical protein